MSTFNTIGFVLSNYDFREADKIFSIYTATHGKIEGLAAGVRKIKSKLRAHLEPFSVVDIMIAHGRHYDRLIGATQQKNYKRIKSNYRLLIISYQLLEIVDQLTKLHHPDSRIFNLLKEAFDFYETHDFTSSLLNLSNNNEIIEQFNNLTIEQSDNEIIGQSPQSNYQLSIINYQLFLRSYFILNFLSLLGYKPELEICVRCKTLVSENFHFSFHDGGVICKRCVANGDRQVSVESIGILKQYLSKNLKDCCDIGNDESSKLVDNFLLYHLDRPLKTSILVKAEEQESLAIRDQSV
ncbi:DNA repair protein RecO [Patescibacteria group bacterium]|nr:DNA repair protein RecO [Patescibacteria group bacterium]MBU4511951.1 DNA repair protein RecO [Patescibacteria group bacterium]MCG2692700.1 DNA repair protein RecO [Candidatus Parcubacteria bacterium]